MKKVFISQSMRDQTHEQILETRNKIISEFTELLGNSFEFIESYQPELKRTSAIDALSASLSMLADANILLVPKWNLDRVKQKTVLSVFRDRTLKGVEFEMLIASSYGVPIIFYTFTEKKDKVLFKFETK